MEGGILTVDMPLVFAGCFDWWGYTDKNYATKKGVQNMAVQKMVEAITGN